jgi:hypothetical protein
MSFYGPTDFVAPKAACSLASSSCESEVIKILPPSPFTSSSTRSLSGVGSLVRTNSVVSARFASEIDFCSLAVLTGYLK